LKELAKGPPTTLQMKEQEQPNREPEESLQKQKRHRLLQERGEVHIDFVCLIHLLLSWTHSTEFQVNNTRTIGPVDYVHCRHIILILSLRTE